MNRQGSLPALDKANISKTKYRILRAKILKILDQNFKKDKNTTRLANDNEELEYSHPKQNKLKTVDLLRMIKNHDTSGINRTLNETFEADQRNSVVDGNASSSGNQDLSVKNLCKFITAEELELICEDPIYFLGRKEYQKNPKLTDHHEWNKQLAIVLERKKKEKNWKETQEALKETFSQSPRNEYFDKLCNSQNNTISMIEDGRDRVSKKKQQIEDHSRFLKEKHEEMHYFAQMRRLEHEDNRERMLNDWTITHMRKCDSVDQRLFQKKLKIKQLILESQQGRDLAQKKLSKFRESRANLQELNKINFEIENIVKQRIVDRHRNEEINKRVEKAKLVGNAKANRPTIGNSSNLVSKNITLNDINTSR